VPSRPNPRPRTQGNCRLKNLGLKTSNRLADVEHMITISGEGLQLWTEHSARTRFNAELVVSLREEKNWRLTWESPYGIYHTRMPPSSHYLCILCYKHTTSIHFRLINPLSSTFPIAISTMTREARDEDFKLASSTPAGHVSTASAVSPWHLSSSANFVSLTRTLNAPTGVNHLTRTVVEVEWAIMLVAPDTQDALRID